jgi:hypothetical protein
MHEAGRAHKIEIERKNSDVHFILKCDSEYDAMMLYDRFTEEMHAGYVKLEIVTKAPA